MHAPPQYVRIDIPNYRPRTGSKEAPLKDVKDVFFDTPVCSHPSHEKSSESTRRLLLYCRHTYLNTDMRHMHPVAGLAEAPPISSPEEKYSISSCPSG